MILPPKQELTEQETNHGLKLVVTDGLATEAMTVLTGGVFLVAMALLLGANNFEIGLLATLPTFTNVFQLVSIWLVRRFNNRRAIVVVCSVLARTPLFIIGSLILFFGKGASVEVLIFFLFFYYLFGSIAGPSWNAWMKDLVPEKSLGAFFSQRMRETTTLNMSLSIVVALLLDFIKKYHPAHQLNTYATMFAVGGLIGLLGAYFLSRTPEPQGIVMHDNIFKLIQHPLKDKNFRRLLTFNAAWIFALNIATPFFTVFLLKSLKIPLSYIIILGIIGQVGSILTLRLWGTFADRYSNKTIIAICAPLYIGCFIAWCFVGIYTHMAVNLALLVLIYLVTGISTAGINLSLTNIGLKLAPRHESIVYLSAKNIISALFSSVSPIIGGLLADFFINRHLYVRIEWGGPKFTKVFRLVELHEWNFLFLIAALLALISLELLGRVKETGEVNKEDVRRILRKSVRGTLREYFLIGQFIGLQEHIWSMFRKKLPNIRDGE